MKLNWFSPLPPAPSGIADYVWQVLPYLRDHAEVILWTSQTEWDTRLERLATVKRIDARETLWPQLNQADMTIYHLGNNADLHHEIWEISCQHPGIVVLHDFVLHHLFAGIYLRHRKDGSGYLSLMRRCYGEAGHRRGEELLRGECNVDALVAEFPLTLPALPTALGVVVHNGNSFESLRTLGRWPVLVAALPFDCGQESPRAAPRTPAADTARRLIVFGHLGSNRRLEEILQALAQLEERECFRLDIYGHVADWQHLAHLSSRLGIAPLVKFHGYVADQQLSAALDRADLAINLRHPSMGEASFSQLLIWRHGLPSLVTKEGWFGDLPDGIVAFVSPESEIEDIKRHLRSFLSHPEPWTLMGQRAQRHLEKEHDPVRYAQQLAELAFEGMRFRVEAEILAMARSIAVDVGRWAHPAARRILARRGAKELVALSEAVAPLPVSSAPSAVATPGIRIDTDRDSAGSADASHHIHRDRVVDVERPGDPKCISAPAPAPFFQKGYRLLVDSPNGSPLWWHSLPLPDGNRINGYHADKDLQLNMWSAMQIPDDGGLAAKKVLDIGANDGFFTVAAAMAGARKVTAIDKHWTCWPFNIQYSCLAWNVDPEIRTGDFLITPLDDVYDVIFLLGVLYHLESPAACMRRLRTLLVEGGVVYVETQMSQVECPLPVFEYASDIYPTIAIQQKENLPLVGISNHLFPNEPAVHNLAHSYDFECQSLSGPHNIYTRDHPDRQFFKLTKRG